MGVGYKRNRTIDNLSFNLVCGTSGFDDEGWYAIMKGDNLEKADPYKVRFENVKRVVVAVIY